MEHETMQQKWAMKWKQMAAQAECSLHIEIVP